MRNPEAEALLRTRWLEEINDERKRSQRTAAQGRMDLDVLDEVMAELNEERETAERELAVARDRRGRIEELESERAFVLSWYGKVAVSDPAAFPPE